MDDFHIGKTILRLRKQKGITQDKLANMIGVSSGAVSKWETESSKPDIHLLSPLARALNATLNELLSFSEEPLDEELSKIKKDITNTFLHSGFSSGENKCSEYLKEYPNSIGLKFTIAGLIHIYSMMLGENFEKSIKEKKEYALSLLYEVVDSKNSKYTHIALFLIGNIQMELKNYKESERCLKELSTSFIDPMVSYASLLIKQEEYKKAENMCEQMLLYYLNESIAMISMLSSISIKNDNFSKADLYLKSANKIEKLFNIGMYSSSYNLCKLHIKMNDKKLAAKYFKDYADDITSFEYDYKNNPYFKNLNLELDPAGQKIIRKNLFETLVNEEDLTVLEAFPEYTEAISKLKTSISKL